MTLYYVDPAATGANTGVDWTNAWVSLQSYLSIMTYGDICLARGEEILTAPLTVDKNLSTGIFASIIGVNPSGVEDGISFFKLNGNSVANTCILFANSNARNYLFKNVYFDDPITYCVATAAPGSWPFNHTFWNCRFSNAVTGIYGLAFTKFKQCYFDNALTHDLYTCGNAQVIECFGIAGNYFCTNTNTPIIANTIFHDYSNGLIAEYYDAYIMNSIMDTTSGEGIYLKQGGCVINTRITNCASGGVQYPLYFEASERQPSYGNNYFYNPTALSDIGGSKKDVAINFGGNRLTASNTEAGYEDIASHDFSIKGSDPGLNIETPIGNITTGAFNNLAHLTQGIQPKASGGRSGRLRIHGV